MRGEERKLHSVSPALGDDHMRARVSGRAGPALMRCLLREHCRPRPLPSILSSSHNVSRLRALRCLLYPSQRALTHSHSRLSSHTPARASRTHSPSCPWMNTQRPQWRCSWTKCSQAENLLCLCEEVKCFSLFTDTKTRTICFVPECYTSQLSECTSAGV